MNIGEPQLDKLFRIPYRKAKKNAAGPSVRRQVRVPFLGWLPDPIRNHFIAMAGEFAGTFLFLFFAFSGTQVANNETEGSKSSTLSQAPNPAQLLYISLCFGFSLAVNAWVFFRISGGLFNPAVTFGMCLIGALPWLRGALLVFSQIIGAMTSAAVVLTLFPGPLNVRTSLGGGTSIAQGLFIEMFLTAQLVFTIFMLAAEKHKGTFIAPVGIGLSLFIAELSGVYYTGGSLNPARSFAPDVVNREFFHYHWIYWLGPSLGAILASGFYKFIKMLEYETANPGQDFDDREIQVFDPDKDLTRPNVSAGPTDYIAESDGQIRPASVYSSQDHSGQEGYPMKERSSSRPTSSHLANSGNPQLPPLKEISNGPTYPPTEGAANYDTGFTSQDQSRSYQGGPNAEAGNYVPPSAGRA